MAQALKEWAIVCRALADGRQIFVARKGGIAEEEGEFTVPHQEFFLFPTYLHQERELVKSKFELEFQMVQDPQDRKLHLSHFARVTDEIPVTDINKLQKIGDQHIWRDRVLRDRFEWGTHSGLTLLVLRVYSFIPEILLPMKKEFGGCKSWVGLDRILPSVGATPSLSDSEYFEKRSRLLKSLV